MGPRPDHANPKQAGGQRGYLAHLDASDWRSLDDTVMGGISASRMAATEDGIRFEGTVSLENNGGFASVRRALSPDLPPLRAIRLTVRGDGNRFQARLRTDEGARGIAWRHVFPTTGEVQQLEIPVEAFEPVFRGRVLADAGPLDPGAIRELGFMTAQKHAGAFALDIHQIQLLGSE